MNTERIDTNTVIGYGTIKAKPTEYMGITFRSALEAEVAAALQEDLLYEWKYEPMKAKSDESNSYVGGQYTPDFYLPEFDCYLEVTPVWDERHELNVAEFHKHHTIYTIDGNGIVGNWQGKPDDQIFDYGTVFQARWDDAKYSLHEPSLYEQGVIRREQKAGAESIKATCIKKPRSEYEWLGMDEFIAEKCGLDFVHLTERGKIDYEAMNDWQRETVSCFKSIWREFNERGQVIREREAALDKRNAVIDAIHRITTAGYRVKLNTTNNCELEIRSAPVDTVLYYPTTGTIKYKKGTGIGGVNDLLMLLAGKSDEEIRACHE